MGDRGKIALAVIFVIVLFTVGVLAARYLQDNIYVQNLISSFGILGILFVAFLSGLNFIVPIPATAFIPIFSTAGFALPIIVSTIVVGTTTADLVSYFLGNFLKNHTDKPKNKTYRLIQKWCEGRPKTTQLVVFIYAVAFPLPNEVLLFPLGTLGVGLRTIFLAFVLGTTLHVSIIAYGLSLLV